MLMREVPVHAETKQKPQKKSGSSTNKAPKQSVKTECLTCPTCRRPMPPSTTDEVKQPTKQKQQQPPVIIAAVAPKASEIKVPEWPCPFLAPELLQPVKKYPRKFYAFTSGQNALSPTKFAVIQTAEDNPIAEKKKKKYNSDDEYDECTND